MSADFFTDPVMAEVERLRELVLDLGEAMARLGQENARLDRESARQAAELKAVQDALFLAGRVADMRPAGTQPQEPAAPPAQADRRTRARARHLRALPGGVA